jgi:hypothetical protein
MPWYSAQDSLDALLVGRRVGMMHIVCYLRQGSNVFETYWTTIRGVEAMDNNYRLLDLTVYGRQETWEDSPPGWPQGDIIDTVRTNGRPTSQWSRLKAGPFGRPGNRQALNRAYQHLDLVPKGATKTLCLLPCHGFAITIFERTSSRLVADHSRDDFGPEPVRKLIAYFSRCR